MVDEKDDNIQVVSLSVITASPDDGMIVANPTAFVAELLS